MDDEENLEEENQQEENQQEENQQEEDSLSPQNSHNNIANKKSNLGAKGKNAAKGVKNIANKLKNVKNLSQLGALGPILFWVIVVILILIVVIGLLGFFLTMPGMIMGKITAFFSNAWKWFESLYKDASCVEKPNAKELVQFADYLTDMGYDLIGYGFVKPNASNSTLKTTEQLGEEGYILVSVENENDKTKENYKERIYFAKDENNLDTYYTENFYYDTGVEYKGVDDNISSLDDLKNPKNNSRAGLPNKDSKDSYYEKYGIKYKDDGKIWVSDSGNSTGLDSVDISVLQTYSMSNSRIYLLRNKNTDFLNVVLRTLNELTTGYKGTWARGLIEIYNAQDNNATDEYDFWDKFKMEAVSISKGKLRVKSGIANNPMEFELDGWSGRYGLSKDFLISLHLATMSPELVETLCQSFDTRIQVYLDHLSKKSTKMYAYYHTKDMVKDDGSDIYMEYNEAEKMRQDSSWNWFDGFFLSREEAKKIMDKYKIKSLTSGKYTCGGNDPSQVLYSFKEGLIENGNSFTRAAEDELNWNKDTFYNNMTEDCTAWIGETSSDSGFIKVLHLDYVPSKDEVEKLEKQKYGWGSGNGTRVPYIIISNVDGIVSEKDSGNRSNAGSSTNAANIDKLKGILGSLENMYNYVKSHKDELNIVKDESPDTIQFNIYNIFDKNSEYYIENYITFDELKSLAEDDTGFYEIPIGVWPTNVSGKKEGDVGYNADEDAEIIISMLIRHTTKDNNYDLSTVMYRTFTSIEMDEKDFGEANEIVCSDANSKSTCNNCKRYIEDIIEALDDVNDQSYDVYVPYIARVIGSWYRDTFFIVPKSAQYYDDDDHLKNDVALKKAYEEYEEYAPDKNSLTLSDTTFIQNDEAFLQETNELWTSYILDRLDYDYAVFLIRPNGEYFSATDKITDYYDNVPQELVDCIGTLKKDGKEYYGYIEFYKGIEKSEYIEDEDRENAERLEELFKENEISYIKIPVTKSADSLETASKSGWSAYNFDSKSVKEYVSLDVTENSPNDIRKVHQAYNEAVHPDDEKENVFWYYLSAKSIVTQVEDGQRGMTKVKTKYLFKNRKYYRYDGTIPRAFSIKSDWLEVIYQFSKSKYVKSLDYNNPFKEIARGAIRLYNPFSRIDELKKILDDMSGENNYKDLKKSTIDLVEPLADGYIDSVYYKEFDLINNVDFKFIRDFDNDGIADLVSKNLENSVNIGNEYHVEENKLKTGGLKITESTKFDYDPRNPDLIARIDLSKESLNAFSILENTHTKDADYAYRDFKELICELDYFDKEDLTASATDILEWILPETGSCGWPNRRYDKNNEYGSLIHTKDMNDNINTIISQIDAAQPTSPDLPEDNSTALLYDENEIYKLANTKISSRDSSSANEFKRNTFVETAEACWQEVVRRNPSYAGAYTGNNDWANSGSNQICCSVYVLWCLYCYGYDITEPGVASCGTLINVDFESNYGFQVINVPGAITDTSILQPGDILIRSGYGYDGYSGDTDVGHVQIIKEVDYSNNTTVILDCGNSDNWNSQYMNGKNSSYFLASTAPGKIIRVNQSSTSVPNLPNVMSGTEKNSIVVSPATARILEIGTTTVTNDTKNDILDLYLVEGENNNANNNSNNTSDDEKDTSGILTITKEQKEKMSEKADELKDDLENSFAKNYKTGYIKLEVIGKNDKDQLLEALKNQVPGFDEKKNYIIDFYEDYISEGKTSDGEIVNSICDNYIIYIEGIDLRVDQQGDWSEDNLIINKILQQSNAGNTGDATIKVTTTDTMMVDRKGNEIQQGSSNVEAKDCKIDNYTRKNIPEYYMPAVRDRMNDAEDRKESGTSVIEVDTPQGKEMYIKAGTLIGLTTDANIKIIMRDSANAVVENVEDYLEIEKGFQKRAENTGSGGVNNIVGGEISASQNGNIRTKDDILLACSDLPQSWQENILDMMDGLLYIQSEYDIDPLVAIALFRGESSMGTAYEKYGQFRLDNHQHWDGCQCNPSKRSESGFCCYDNYTDNVKDWGNYVHNRFDVPLNTWDLLAHGPNNGTVYENCNVDDGNHAISHYKKLIENLNNSK